MCEVGENTIGRAMSNDVLTLPELIEGKV